MYRTNWQGRQIIKSSETLRLRTYRCPAGKLTIGWGDTGPDVVPGLTITEEEADERFNRRLAEDFEPGVESLLAVPVSGNQFSALVSLAYNIGLEAFAESTLLRKLNAGDYAGAASEFARWTRSRGRVLPGLVTRREAERALFCTTGDGAYDEAAA